MNRMRTALAAAYALIFWGFAVGAAAQAVDARTAALGGSLTALPGDFWAQANPAAWAGVRRQGFGVGVAQLFGLSELRAASSLLVWPLGRTVAVSGLATFGYELYRETTASLGFARTVHAGTHRAMHAGTRLRWRHVHISGYGRASAGSASAGLILPVTPSVAIGAASANLVVVGAALRPEMQRSLSLGAAFLHPSMVLTTDVFKELRSPLTIRMGAEMRPVPVLAFRAGFTMDPARASLGFGLRTPHVLLDAAAERHDILGWSPFLSMTVAW